MLPSLPGTVLVEELVARTPPLALAPAALGGGAAGLDDDVVRAHARVGVADADGEGLVPVVLDELVDGLLVVPEAHGQALEREAVLLARLHQLHAAVARRPPGHHPAPHVHAARVRQVEEGLAPGQLAQLGQHERLRQAHQERRRLADVGPVLVVEGDGRVVARKGPAENLVLDSSLSLVLRFRGYLGCLMLDAVL